MLTSRIQLLLSVFALALTAPSSLVAAPAPLSQQQIEFFEKHIRPALVKHCYECHSDSSGKTRGGLLVDFREGLLQGGDSGPALVAGNLDESALWNAINWSDYEMPPSGKMPAETIAHFKAWIEMGAPDPRVREQVIVASEIDIEQGKQHWAFQPLKRSNSRGIDAYVARRLESAGIQPEPAADHATLLRRLHFDLTGLPPTPAEVLDFLDATQANFQAAVEAKVDELLARPQFGERWGRYWLDVARYAESTGKDVNFTFPYAWRYRDYVIDSFNQDKPYDQFIQEQIAGDLLPWETDQQWQEQVIATGFLAIGTKGLNERNPRTFRMDVVDEQIDVMSQAILGITVACARCHDHKFDPIPTTDYYALAGVFLSTQTLYGTNAGPQNRRPADLIMLPIADEHPLGQSATESGVREMRNQIRTLQQEARQLRPAGGANLTADSRRDFVRLRNRIAQLQGQLSTLNDDGSPMTLAMGVWKSEVPENARVLVGGDVERPAQEVQRGFLQVLDETPAVEIPPSESGRRELANWLTSRDNPLTARVMANRVWLHLFGEGLVSTPNNWGATGQPPTYPELLDDLALRFMNYDWSIKSLIRDIVLSKAYQRSSQFNAASYAIDPDNHLLWRSNPRQLDAEALRDAILTAGGNLNTRRPIGSVVAEVGDARVGRQFNPQRIGQTQDYRSVYLPVLRDSLPESLALFDFADPSLSNAKRDATNVPSQALYLMNNQFVTDQAAAMAKHLSSRSDNLKQQVETAFLLAYGRPATQNEVRTAIKFVRRFASDSNTNPRKRAVAQQEALAAFCQALMASAEFRLLN